LNWLRLRLRWRTKFRLGLEGGDYVGSALFLEAVSISEGVEAVVS
jgi:hypothetical protein